MERIEVKVCLAPGADESCLPRYMTPGAAGLDLVACCPVILKAGDRALVPTGVHIELPPGFEGQVRPRSGLALKSGVTVLNAPGTIDSDYRGEVRVILVNLGPDPVTINQGDRIAQLVVSSVTRADVRLVDELSSTARESGGFGHTGSCS